MTAAEWWNRKSNSTERMRIIETVCSNTKFKFNWIAIMQQQPFVLLPDNIKVAVYDYLKSLKVGN